MIPAFPVNDLQAMKTLLARCPGKTHIHKVALV